MKYETIFALCVIFKMSAPGFVECSQNVRVIFTLNVWPPLELECVDAISFLDKFLNEDYTYHYQRSK